MLIIFIVDPFFEIWRTNELIYRSEYLKQNLNPSWQPFVLRLSTSTGGLDAVLELKCFDWDGTGEHDLIGQSPLSIRECSFGELQVSSFWYTMFYFGINLFNCSLV